MKRYFGVIVVVVGFIAMVAISYSSHRAKVFQAERDANAARIARDYLERVGWIRNNPDEKTYQDEVNTFFKWYFKEVADHLSRFEGNKEFDDYLGELDKRAGAGKDVKIAEKKAYFDKVKKTFDTFRSATYRPVWSATDKGLRLDVASSDVKMVLGEPKVRMELVLWGANRELRTEDRGVKKMVTYATFDTNFKLFDAKGKLFGEMTASGDPQMRIDYPERYVGEFPPQMVLGHYDWDLLPADVAKVEITFKVSSRHPVTGGEALASYVWKLDPPSEWKLKSGQKWEGAQETTRSEDEIDPSRAAAR